jgi:hypothetical protein
MLSEIRSSLLRDETLNIYACIVVFCDLFIRSQRMLVGKQHLCDKKGKDTEQHLL